MGFFEPPPPPHGPPPHYRRPKWMKPDNVLGEPVPITVLMARSAKAAVQVGHITAYHNGFEFRVVAHCRLQAEIWDPMHGLAGLRGRPGQRGGEMDAEILRFGIRWSDGSKATNLGPPMVGPTDQEPKGPMLQHGGGSSGGSVAEQAYWSWPLPPPGGLAFVCEWPKWEVPLTEKEIDASLILDAANQAVELWPDDRPDDEPGGSNSAGWSGYISH